MNIIGFFKKNQIFTKLLLFKLNLSYLNYSVFSVEKGSETNEKTFQKNNANLFLNVNLCSCLFPDQYNPLKDRRIISNGIEGTT